MAMSPPQSLEGRIFSPPKKNVLYLPHSPSRLTKSIQVTRVFNPHCHMKFWSLLRISCLYT
eukprot:UN06829